MHDLGTISGRVKGRLHNFLAPTIAARRGKSAPDSIAAMKGHFGETVRALREAVHLSQAELAAKVGMHRNAISRVERLQEPRMHPGNYRALAAALGYEPGQLDFLWRHGERLVGDALDIARSTDVPAPQWILDHFGLKDADAYLALAPVDFDSRDGHLGDRVLVSPRSPMNKSGLKGLVESATPAGGVRRYIGECYQEQFGITIRIDRGVKVIAPQTDIRTIHRVIGAVRLERFPEPLGHEKRLRLVAPPVIESGKKKPSKRPRSSAASKGRKA